MSLKENLPRINCKQHDSLAVDNFEVWSRDFDPKDTSNLSRENILGINAEEVSVLSSFHREIV